MNIAILMGNLTKDFEVRYSAGGTAVARSGMALNRGKDKDGNDKGADFVNLLAFGKTAEFCEKYGRKGRKFVVRCHVQTGSYEKDGKKVYTTDFVIDEMKFADSKPEGNTAAPAPKTSNATGDGFLQIPDDMDDLPFK